MQEDRQNVEKEDRSNKRADRQADSNVNSDISDRLVGCGRRGHFGSRRRKRRRVERRSITW